MPGSESIRYGLLLQRPPKRVRIKATPGKTTRKFLCCSMLLLFEPGIESNGVTYGHHQS
jgi:hypothetical protein